MNKETQAFDGDYQIIFSDTFNLYENRLILKNIYGYTVEFIFEKGEFNKELANVSSEADESNKKLLITLKNFRNQIGAGNTEKMAVMNLLDDKKIYLSIYGKSISTASEALVVTVNFYLK